MVLRRLLQYLKQVYPYYWVQKQLHWIVLLVVLSSFIFNYTFQPFVVYVPEHKMSYLWICVVHSVLPGLICYVYFSLVNWWGVEEDKWTIGKEAILVFLLLFCVGLGNFLVRDFIYDNPWNWSVRFFVVEIRNAILVGALIILVVLPINFRRLFNKHKHDAAMLHALKRNAEKPGLTRTTIFIKTQVKADDFVVDTSRILFVKAAGNYVEIHLITTEMTIEVLLKRIPMKELERQLAPFPHLVKTHRTYLVNTREIAWVVGSAQGYILSFNQTAETVPVARGRIESFKRVMEDIRAIKAPL